MEGGCGHPQLRAQRQQPVRAVSKGGTIKGHVRVKGPLPGNAVIRMGMDPMCATLNAGQAPRAGGRAATADGSLANVFVSLQGSISCVARSHRAGDDRSACVRLRASSRRRARRTDASSAKQRRAAP